MKLNERHKTKLSGFMSKILRHEPKRFGITLNENGECTIEELVSAIRKQPQWKFVTEDHILDIVKTCPKQRYEVNNNKIRARYGHSIQVVQNNQKRPPEYLYHGTHEGVVQNILDKGILPMSRQYVHLSETTDFASLAGQRRGKLVLLRIDTQKAIKQGVQFYFAGNEVWLSKAIPSDCIAEVISDSQPFAIQR